jgi:hypothetical protein
MAGRLYATELTWKVWKHLRAGEAPYIDSVKVEDGGPPREPLYAPWTWTNDPLAVSAGPRSAFRRGSGLRYALRWHLFPYPGAEALSLSHRLRATWQAFRGRKRQTFSQRVQWGGRAFRATIDKPIPPSVPRLLRRPYVWLRGLRYARRTYWRTR